jgi:hypothetical protein
MQHGQDVDKMNWLEKKILLHIGEVIAYFRHVRDSLARHGTEIRHTPREMGNERSLKLIDEFS